MPVTEATRGVDLSIGEMCKRAADRTPILIELHGMVRMATLIAWMPNRNGRRLNKARVQFRSGSRATVDATRIYVPNNLLAATSRPDAPSEKMTDREMRSTVRETGQTDMRPTGRSRGPALDPQHSPVGSAG